MGLRSASVSKIIILLNSLPPSYIKGNDNTHICVPDNSIQMIYEILTNLLKQYLDPQTSVWARQHNFIVREQHAGESITEF